MELNNRKKAVLLSLIVLGVVALIGGPGIIAYFSDTETSAPNLFSAGTIDLSVNGGNPWTGTLNGDLTDLKPCMEREATATLTNVGSNPMEVWMKIIDVTTADGANPEPENGEPSATDIDSVIKYNVSVDGGTTWLLGSDYTVSAGAHHLAGKTTGVKDNYIFLGTIAAGQPMTVTQLFSMDCLTTNWAQGDEMNFKVEFYAQQNEGDLVPPAPTPELPGEERPARAPITGL